jgi:iron-sulfur cluster repair protein YtfE (RIC family)
MKRHPSLHPLSRDHHHALVQARNLSAAAATKNPAELKQAAERFADYWESELQWHFAQEEQFVLPLLSKHQSPEAAEIRETLNQHAEIRRLVIELKDGLTRREVIQEALLDELGESLRRHIRFEENELFPALEAEASEAELRLMSEQIEQDRNRRGVGGCALSPKSTAPENGRSKS